MDTVAQFTWQSQQDRGLDDQSAAAATDALDAQLGAQLLRDLSAKWVADGYALYLDGQPLSACWSPEHRRGWLEAQELTESVFEQVVAKPYLQDVAVEEEIEFINAILDEIEAGTGEPTVRFSDSDHDALEAEQLGVDGGWA